MLVVKKQRLDVSCRKMVAEASDIGLAPGEWPDFIAVVDDKNEGVLFLRTHPMISEVSGLLGFYYYSNQDHQLLVLND